MTEISPTSFAEMKAELTHVRATLDELARDVRPVLLARSGDLAAVASLQRDISASHEKHSETTRRLAEVDERIDAVQRRFDNAKAYVFGAAAVIQVLISLVAPAVLRMIGLGG